MKDNLPRYTLRMPQMYLDKLGYIADYEGRSKNKELIQIVKAYIAAFEETHGPIPWPLAEEPPAESSE